MPGLKRIAHTEGELQHIVNIFAVQHDIAHHAPQRPMAGDVILCADAEAVADVVVRTAELVDAVAVFQLNVKFIFADTRCRYQFQLVVQRQKAQRVHAVRGIIAFGAPFVVSRFFAVFEVW